MKAIITAILLFSLSGAFAQEKAVEEHFRRDVENKSLKLYILGGIAPKYYDNDEDFQKKYKVTFKDFGCLAPANLSYYQEYNVLVFVYLSEQHAGWESETSRKNFLGWEKWKDKK